MNDGSCKLDSEFAAAAAAAITAAPICCRNYVSIGQSTVGVQRSWMEGTGDTGMMGEMENSSVFPEGVDCMVAGVVTFVESN